MFLLSVRVSKRRLIPLILCVALIAAMLIAAVLFPVSRTMISDAGITVQTEEEAVAYLMTCGYTARLPAAETREVRLPDVFDGALAEYEDLQQQAGFSLERYAGQNVLCRTFALTDSPHGDGSAAHLYTLQGQLLGGDIASADGALFPLLPLSPERM